MKTQEEINKELRKILGVFVHSPLSTEQSIKQITALFRPEWHKYPEEKPLERGKYIVTVKCDDTDRLEVTNDYWLISEHGSWWVTFGSHPYCNIIAFMELPSPYKPESHE